MVKFHLMKLNINNQSKGMAPKAKTVHTHSICIDGVTINISFDDKRTYNSVVNALEKAKSITLDKNEENSPKNESMIVETPNSFAGYELKLQKGLVLRREYAPQLEEFQLQKFLIPQ